MVVILDSGILILVIADPEVSNEAKQCQAWLERLLSRGIYIIVPEICDYEVRRGLIFEDKRKGRVNGIKLQALNKIKSSIDFVPLTSRVLLKAAELWAEVQINGRGNRKGVNVDMIVSAHWHIEKENFPGRYIVIATKNLKDFEIFDDTIYEVECESWEHICI